VLVEKHKILLTNRFCQALANWTVHDVATEKTFEIAQQIHDSAKEIDNNCAVGTMVANEAELTNFSNDDDSGLSLAYM
jgi:hypothetical protein